jgi:hypothetical protein
LPYWEAALPLGPDAGKLPTISEVLAGKKAFSRHMMRRFADYFCVDVSILAANLQGGLFTEDDSLIEYCGPPQECLVVSCARILRTLALPVRTLRTRM